MELGQSVTSLMGDIVHANMETQAVAPEHAHYPWLLSIIFAAVLKLQGSADPMPLQILGFGVFLLTLYLYRRTAPQAAWGDWLLFALVPVAGRFVFRLYADVWLVAALLLFALWVRSGRPWAAAVVLAFGIFLKQEAAFQFGLLTAFLLWQHSRARAVQWRELLPLGTWLLAAAAYFLWAQAFRPLEGYAPLGARLMESVTYTERLPQVLRYLADVFFRPSLWGILWPYLIWRFRAQPFALGLIGFALASVVAAYLRYPSGTYREVVLTGAPRVLWQFLPLMWVCLNAGRHRVTEATTG